MELLIKPTFIIVVLGKRGGGKSVVIRYIIRTCDFRGTIIYDGNHHVDKDYDKERDFRDMDNITVVPRKFTDPAWENFNDSNLHKNKFVVIDEFDMVNAQHPDFYKEWVNSGRHWPSGGIAAGRRPTMLPRDVTANADLTLIFRARESSVQKFIKESYTDDVSEIAAHLGKYEFLIVDAAQDPIARCRISDDGPTGRLEVLEEYSPEDTGERVYRQDSKPNPNAAIPPQRPPTSRARGALPPSGKRPPTAE